ncbi:MAG: hypothetical protein ACTH5D_05115 [Halomonas sp.]|uniref:hypothetical protein n=1 Tax=Halomonas sp. TaxID=1486246 RepID=UPI003F93CF33
MTKFQAVIKVSKVAELAVWAIRIVILFAVSLSATIVVPMILSVEGFGVAIVNIVKALLVLFGVPLAVISLAMIVKLISAYKYVVSDN